ncbi:hypothetical protein SAMN05421682_10158 [Chryseobacterium indoltheticum]|uniref:Uncharacterized protein n=1 Tax=Chryseobacterium indoltheticum TaxID=254 RepID=A0A381F729_9FLAO|nr:hypothetical protein SAMN05421682_10158 [Chryseobacterium indoltheticum]SUX42370.1 Uncharacterised protein [Chryseobacterium indoltheticum]
MYAVKFVKKIDYFVIKNINDNEKLNMINVILV